MSELGDALGKLVKLKRITTGGLGAEPQATGSYGGLAAHPPTAGRFSVCFWEKYLF